MDELTLEVERVLPGDESVLLTLEIPVDNIDGGETAIRSGHPDRWTEGYGPSVDFGDPVIKSIDGGPGDFKVGGTVELTKEETEEAGEKVLDACKQEAEDAYVEARLSEMEDDYDYCKY